VETENENLRARIGQHSAAESLLNSQQDVDSSEKRASNPIPENPATGPTHSVQQTFSKMPHPDSDAQSSGLIQQESNLL